MAVQEQPVEQPRTAQALRFTQQQYLRIHGSSRTDDYNQYVGLRTRFV